MGKILQDRLVDSWTEDDILALHGDIVTTFMKSQDEYGINAAVEYASYLKYRGLDNQNYPMFLDLLSGKCLLRVTEAVFPWQGV